MPAIACYYTLLEDELLLLELEVRQVNRRHEQLMRIPAWSADICREVDEIRDFLDRAAARKAEILYELEF